MTADEIRNGGAFQAVVRREYRWFLNTLIGAINYCCDQEEQQKVLTDVGEAGFARLNALFSESAQQNPTAQGTAEERLLSTWAYMILHCMDTRRHFAAYAEANVLLESMMAGGWFA